MADARNGDGSGVALPDDEERLRRETDEVVRLYGEFLLRLSNQGIRDIADLAELQDRVLRATATVSLPEIDFALAQLRAVVDRMHLIAARLARLGEIKRGIGGAEGT
jgi:hypothetical protein